MLEMMNKHNPFPQQLVIEVTAACNQDCIFCGRTYMERPKRSMKRWMWDRIVEEVAKESPYTEIWPAFMGESMILGDKLFDMIAYARKVGCKKITLNTNGTRLNEKTIPRILEGNIDRLIISCDAHTPETHEIVRPGRKTEGLAAIYLGVLKLSEEIRRMRLQKPIIEMQFSVFDENEHETEDFKQFWFEKGLIVKLRPKVYWSGVVSDGNHRMTLGDHRKECLWSLDTACIHWNGNVVMCAIDSEGKYVAGNLEMQSLQVIWDGPLKWIRELHIRKRFSELPEICRKCPDWEVKKAHAFFPNEEVKQDYEAYISKGRTFTARHFWKENIEQFK